MKIFTTKEAASSTGLTIRTIQYKCKEDNIKKRKNKYLITQKHIDKWTQDETNDDIISQDFTIEEYLKLESIIKQHPINLNDIKHLEEAIESYRHQIEYLKKSLDKKDAILEKILGQLQDTTKTVHQLNFMDAKRNKFDE